MADGQTAHMIDLDGIRVFLHLLGVAGWIGGQMVMVGLLPLLRTLGPDVPRQAAARFARVAWPCFGLAIITGLWSLLAVDLGDRTTGYLTVLLVKLLLVGLSGAAAAIHSATRSVALREVTGALGALAALGALFAGAILVT
jgi:putative copper export protein